jgi:thymidylate kinase
LLAHACPAPDLVLVLDAPGEVLYARKGEHSADFLEQQRQQYIALRARLPEMIVVDATRDAERVRRDALAAIWRGYIAHLSRT